MRLLRVRVCALTRLLELASEHILRPYRLAARNWLAVYRSTWYAGDPLQRVQQGFSCGFSVGVLPLLVCSRYPAPPPLSFYNRDLSVSPNESPASVSAHLS